MAGIEATHEVTNQPPHWRLSLYEADRMYMKFAT